MFWKLIVQLFNKSADILSRSKHFSRLAHEKLGEGGLGMFLKGAYSSKWASAGMLGYVQNDSVSKWMDKLLTGFSSRQHKLGVCENPPRWQSAGWSDSGLAEVKESHHERTQPGLGRIALYHLLLEVC